MLDAGIAMVLTDAPHLGRGPDSSLPIPMDRGAVPCPEPSPWGAWSDRGRPGLRLHQRLPFRYPSIPPAHQRLHRRVPARARDHRVFLRPILDHRLHDVLADYDYVIQPDRDVNGMGLLYFANYPLFFDLAERDALERSRWAWSHDLINKRTIVSRK